MIITYKTKVHNKSYSPIVRLSQITRIEKNYSWFLTLNFTLQVINWNPLDYLFRRSNLVFYKHEQTEKTDCSHITMLQPRWLSHTKPRFIISPTVQSLDFLKVRSKKTTWGKSIQSLNSVARSPKDCSFAISRAQEVKRKRWRPKTTWRRTVEKEQKEAGWSSCEETRTREKWGPL